MGLVAQIGRVIHCVKPARQREGMSSWAPTKYRTANWSAYFEALKRRGSLTVWFDPDMVWKLPATGKRGRQPSFSNAAIQTRPV